MLQRQLHNQRLLAASAKQGEASAREEVQALHATVSEAIVEVQALRTAVHEARAGEARAREEAGALQGASRAAEFQAEAETSARLQAAERQHTELQVCVWGGWRFL